MIEGVIAVLDAKDLEAIAQLMDVKLDPINTRLDRLESKVDRLESRMDKLEEKVDQQGSELRTEIKESEKRMLALTEGYFDKKFGLLADGHSLIIQQMVKKEDFQEAQEMTNIRLDALEALGKRHSMEIEKLKKAQ